MIYVVEDDLSIQELECYVLKQAGFEVQGFDNGKDFLIATARKIPQLVLLDVMLPGDDGHVLLKKLRGNPQTRRVPIVMVTAKGEEFDKVQGLDGGADDYIVKPFGVMELISRVKAVLRRSQVEEPQTELVCGDLHMDTERHKVFAKDKSVALTYMEFELLEYLMRNQGIALTRERLLDTVWGMNYLGDTRTVDVHMRTLRVKLGEVKKYLQTVRGVGYRMEVEDAKEDI